VSDRSPAEAGRGHGALRSAQSLWMDPMGPAITSRRLWLVKFHHAQVLLYEEKIEILLKPNGLFVAG